NISGSASREAALQAVDCACGRSKRCRAIWSRRLPKSPAQNPSIPDQMGENQASCDPNHPGPRPCLRGSMQQTSLPECQNAKLVWTCQNLLVAGCNRRLLT